MNTEAILGRSSVTRLVSLEEAVAIARDLEPVAAANGFHVGLTGGCLYRDGERKDVDLIFYPHDRVSPAPAHEMIAALMGPGGADLTLYKRTSEGYSDRDVLICNRRGVRIDVFFMTPNAALPAS